MTRTPIRAIALTAALMLAPTAASAADWWWVAGEPGSHEAWFVDTDSIAGGGSEKSFRLLYVRQGQAPDERLRHADCAGTVSGGDDQSVQRFVCATPEQRLSLGAMLGPIDPQVAANALFDAPNSAMAHR